MQRVGMFFFLCAVIAHADEPESPLLAEGKQRYRNTEYDKCVDKMIAAERAGPTPEERPQIALYEGLCDYYLGRLGAAQTAFERALKLDPQVHLPAFTSPKIADFFKQIADAMPKNAAPETKPEPAKPEPTKPEPVQQQQPPPEAVILPAPPSQPVLVPILGGLLTAAALATAIAFGVEAQRIEGVQHDAHFEYDGFRYATLARNDATGANVAYALAGGLVLVTALTWWLTWRN